MGSAQRHANETAGSCKAAMILDIVRWVPGAADVQRPLQRLRPFMVASHTTHLRKLVCKLSEVTLRAGVEIEALGLLDERICRSMHRQESRGQQSEVMAGTVVVLCKTLDRETA